MSNLLFCYAIFSISVSPPNIYREYYNLIPPLGKIRSIAASPRYIFVASDNYLIFFNKPDFTFEKAVMFDRNIEMLGYDRWTNDLWVISRPEVVRFTPFTYTTRSFPFTRVVSRFAIDDKNLYLDTGTKYRLEKRSGRIEAISSFPAGLHWIQKFTAGILKKYPFLTPYYYFDNEQESQMPFQRYPITTIYDDGMDLYVGTDHFGLLKYNKVSGQHQRIIYGPLDPQIDRVYQIDSTIHFLCAGGISYFQPRNRKWHYLRLRQKPVDIIRCNQGFIFGIENRLLKLSGTFTYPISDFKGRLLCLARDTRYIYIGTGQGLFRLPRSGNEPTLFGPAGRAIYAIFITENRIYAGGENGFYCYDKKNTTWSIPFNFGVKDIVSIGKDLYLLSLNNQIIKYLPEQSHSDTTWFLLPYFNIYDITTDQQMLYCASYAGVYYYNPETMTYQIIYHLPRIKYDYLFFIQEKLIAVGDNKIFSLSKEYLR